MKFTLLDYLVIITRWRKLLLKTFLIFAVLSVCISLIIPKQYLATASIIPPDDDSLLGLSSLLSDLPIGMAGLQGMSGTAMLPIAILNSRLLHQSIIDEFDLKKELHAKDNVTALKRFRKNLSVIFAEDGIIIISYLDKNPDRASSIVNSIIQKLDKHFVRLKVEQASKNKEFIGKRLNTNKAELKTAEEALKAFQEQYKMVALPEQVAAIITKIATLDAEKTKLEIRKGVLKSSMQPKNRQLKMIDNEITELDKQLENLIYSKKAQFHSPVDIPISVIPDVGLKFSRLMRNFKIQETIFEFLIQQYEQAKLQETKETPALQLLDKAIPPDRKAKPKRALIVIFSTFLGMLCVFCYILLHEKIQYFKSNEVDTYNKIMQIRKSFLS